MRLFASLFVLLVLASCGEASTGDDSTGDEPAKSEAERLCEAICADIDAARCENADEPCIPSCLHNVEPCVDEARMWIECQPTIACNQDGRPVSTSCELEWLAFGECAPG